MCTPTMTMERGRPEASTMASMVSCWSVMACSHARACAQQHSTHSSAFSHMREAMSADSR